MKRRHIMLCGLAALIPVLAFAADPATANMHQFTPPKGDASVGLLREVFGNAVGMAMGEGPGTEDSVAAAGFRIFNSAVLFLSAVFVMYTTIKGTIDSAHDGELLGRKMSSIWVPLRAVAGIAGLLPLSNGFSLVQVAVLWVALLGVGAADKVWEAMMDKLSQDNMIGRPSIPDSRPLAANILRFEVCMAAMNKQFQESGRPDRIQVSETQRTITNTGEILSAGNLATAAIPVAGAVNLASSIVNSRYTVSEYQWAASAGTYQNPNVCGALHWTQSEESSESNGSTSVAKGPILAAHSQAVKSMISTLRPAAAQIVAGNKPAPGVIDQAAFTYENALRDGAKTAVQQSNDKSKTEFIQLAKDGGWLYAGTYYNQIVRLNDAMQSTINALPTSEPVSIDDKETHETLLTYRDALAVTDEYIKNRSHSPQSAYQQEWQSAYKDPDGSVKVPRSWEDIKRLFSLPAMGAIHQMTQEIAGSNLSHISQMKAVGDTIVSAAWGLAGTLAVGSGLANSNAAKLTVGNVFDVGAALASMSGMLGTIFSLLLMAGLILAFYVPMIPYICWITGCIKWLVITCEAEMSSPIFGAAHVHPDGDDTVGKAGPGYMIILSVFLRPMLMTFGMIFSITLAQPITHLVNSTYMTAVAGSMHDSFNGLGAFVAYSVLYAFIMAIVVHSVFALINYLPDNVLRWLGNAIAAHGIGDQEQHEVKSVYAGVAQQGAHGAAAGAGKPKTPPAAPPASESPTMQELLPPPV